MPKSNNSNWFLKNYILSFRVLHDGHLRSIFLWILKWKLANNDKVHTGGSCLVSTITCGDVIMWQHQLPPRLLTVNTLHNGDGGLLLCVSHASRRNRRARVINCDCASRGGGPAARTWDPRFTPRPRHRAAAVNTATDDSRRPSKKQHYFYCEVREVVVVGGGVFSEKYFLRYLHRVR